MTIRPELWPVMFNFEHLDEFGFWWVRLPCPEWQVNVPSVLVPQFSARNSMLECRFATTKTKKSSFHKGI